MEKKKRILLVEDEREMATLLELVLRHAGYETVLSADGKNMFPFYADKTFDQKKHSPFDMVILDKQLNGEKNGLDICKLLRADIKTKDLPVIILSATPKANKDWIACGADDFVEKPFDLNHLLDVIGRYLRCTTDGSGPSSHQT